MMSHERDAVPQVCRGLADPTGRCLEVWFHRGSTALGVQQPEGCLQVIFQPREHSDWRMSQFARVLEQAARY